MGLNQSEREHLWNTYVELGTMERHFGDAQLRCRALASTWFLAMFAGIGFLISKDIKGFSPDVLLAAIGFFSAAALFVMWVIDLIIYQRLLDAAFIEGMSLEEAQPWLPQVRLNRRELLKGTGLIRFSRYYAIAFGVAWVVGCISAIRALVLKYPDSKWSYVAAFLMVSILVYFELRALRETKSTKDYEHKIRQKRTSDYANYEQYREMAFSLDARFITAKRNGYSAIITEGSSVNMKTDENHFNEFDTK